MIDSSCTIVGNTTSVCQMLVLYEYLNECSTCISTMQRTGVITELVLAFFGRGFGNNTHSGAKNGKQ